MGIDGQENENIKEAEPVVQESIKPRYKKKLKKLLEVVVFAIIAGVIFGLTVRFVFGITPSEVSRLINKDNEVELTESSAKRSEVTLQPAVSTTAVPEPAKEDGMEKQPVSLVDNSTVKDTASSDTPVKDEDNKAGGEVNPGNAADIDNRPIDDKGSTAAEGDRPSNTDNEQPGDKPAIVVITPVKNDEEPVPTTTVSLNGNEDNSGSGSEEVSPEGDGTPAVTITDNDSTDDNGQSENDGTGQAVEGASEDSTGEDRETSDNTAEVDANAGNESDSSSAGTDVTGTEDEDGKGSNDKREDTVAPVFSLEAYRQLMDELHAIASDAGKGLVAIKATTSIVNWMGENVENTVDTIGGIVADNGVELLIVTYYDKLKGADSIEVALGTGSKYEASLLAGDAGYNMAVIAVPLKEISADELENITTVKFGSTSDIYAGMPIIAIGSPNGNMGSVEYGYITGYGKTMYVTDGMCSLFMTDITNSQSSEGVILNLDGELIGVISRSTTAAALTGTSTEITVESLLVVAQRLCNGLKMPYFGIMAEDVPESALKELNIENGIYVDEVSSSSPAAVAEIHKGDIITAINDTSIDGVRTFSSILLEVEPGEAITVKLYRSSQKGNPEMTVTVIPE